ncbi:FAD binding domain-containing protein [bacterium]|nr:FAD binding domain-containing protein [bacterium]
MIKFFLNGSTFETQLPQGMSLLDVIRNEAHLHGTKRACGEGDCGACTVIIGTWNAGELQFSTTASCILPVASVHGKHVITVEGLNQQQPNPIQQIMIETGASQCGFCTPGIVLALTGFLLNSTHLSTDDAIMWIEGNICRCTGYAGIYDAARAVADKYRELLKNSNRVSVLVEEGILPTWISAISDNSIHPIDTTMNITGNNVLAVSGATDVYVQKQDKFQDLQLYMLSNTDIRKDIRLEDNHVYIGGLTTVETVRQSGVMQEIYPEIEQKLRLLSSMLIRQRATVAGNLVNASPIADMAIILLTMDAVIEVKSKNSQREIPLAQFYKAYKTLAMEEDELIYWIKIPTTLNRSKFNFEKVSRRNHLDIASVNTACRILHDNKNLIHEATFTAGGVAPVPLLLKHSSTWLCGRSITPETIRDLLKIIDDEIAPISDVRGRADYKRQLLKRLVVAHFITLFPELHPEDSLI